MPKSQQSWVRSQHPPTQWNLRAADKAVLNIVHRKKIQKISCLINQMFQTFLFCFNKKPNQRISRKSCKFFLYIYIRGFQQTNRQLYRNYIIYFLKYLIQHSFVCYNSDSAVSEDAGIEPRTVETLALTARRSNHSARSHPH